MGMPWGLSVWPFASLFRLLPQQAGSSAYAGGRRLVSFYIACHRCHSPSCPRRPAHPRHDAPRPADAHPLTSKVASHRGSLRTGHRGARNVGGQDERGTRRGAPAASRGARRHPERQGRTPDTPRCGTLRERKVAVLARPPRASGVTAAVAPHSGIVPPPTPRRRRARRPPKASGVVLRAAPARPLPPGAPTNNPSPARRDESVASRWAHAVKAKPCGWLEDSPAWTAPTLPLKDCRRLAGKNWGPGRPNARRQNHPLNLPEEGF